METKHIYKASPLGTCLFCGRSKQDCESVNLRSAWNQDEQEDEFNKPNIFYQQIPDSCTVLQIVCTKSNSLLLSNSGDVYSWGECTFALGRDCESIEMSRVPEIIPEFSEVSVIRLAAGEDHVIARDSQSRVWTWGSNDYGQLGHGNLEPSATPEIVPGISSAVRIFAGPDWTACLVSEQNASRDGLELCVWGDNRNNQLGLISSTEMTLRVLSSEDDTKIKVPKILRDTPWSPNSHISVASDKRSKSMFYSSKFNPDTAIGGITKYNIERVLTENQDLKRRLEMYSKKIIDAEYKIYKDIAPNPVTWESDLILEQIVNYYNDMCEKIKLAEIKLEKTNSSVLGLKNDIKAKVAQIKDFEYNENMMWENLDKSEENKLQMIGQEETYEYKELIAKIRDLKKRVLAVVDDKKTLHSELRDLQEKIQKKSERITELEGLRNQNEFEKNLLDQVREFRIKQIIYEFFEKNQNAIELDIKNLQSINEATRDTSIEYLSTAVSSTTLSGFIQESDTLLGNLEFEISMMIKDSSRTALGAINQLWSIIDDNVHLRQKLNKKIKQLLQLTAANMPKFEEDLEKVEKFDQNKPKEDRQVMNEQLLKRILLAKTQQSNEAQEEDQDETERPRTSTGQLLEIKEVKSRSTWSWRACC